MKDLAPHIYRQRLVIEGNCDEVITDTQIQEYLAKLSTKLNMITLTKPVTHMAEEFGWAGWIHRSTSGAHFYARDKPTPFFSVDIYTCKAFETSTALAFTQEFFSTTAVSHKEI